MVGRTQRSKRQKKAAQAKRSVRQGSLILDSRNVLLLILGIIVILVGYYLLGKGSVTAAPLLLVIGYCVMIPLSIILWVRRPDSKRESGTGE